MNSYLVYLLLVGKNMVSTHGEVNLIGKEGTPIWRYYPKWFIRSKYSHFYMKDKWLGVLDNQGDQRGRKSKKDFQHKHRCCQGPH